MIGPFRFLANLSNSIRAIAENVSDRVDPFRFLGVLSSLMRARAFGKRIRVEFYRDMFLMQRGGVSKLDALRTIERTYTRRLDFIDGLPPALGNVVRRFIPQPAMVQVAQEGIAGVRAGRSLDKALGTWVPPAETALLAAGEASGELVPAYTRAIKLIESQEGMWSAAIAGCAYPVALIVMLGYTLVVFATDMVPALAGTVKPESLGFAGTFVVALSQFVAEWWRILFFLIMALTVAVFLSLPTYTGPGRVWLDRLPPWSIYRQIHGALFLSSFSTLQRSGMPIEKCLTTLADSASPWLRSRIEAALYGVRQGYNLGRSLRNAGYEFPDRSSLAMLELFCSQARYVETLEEFAQDWMRETAKQIVVFSKRFLIIGLLVVAVIVGLLAIGLVDIQSAVV